MPELITVDNFIKQTWEDYHSPTTSTFDKKMTKCKSTVSNIEEELDTDKSELTKLKKSIRALHNSTNKHAQNEKDIAENLERIGKSTSNNHTEINTAFQEFAKLTKMLSAHIEDLSKSVNKSLQWPLESFLKGDIKGVKGDLRKPFDKAGKDYESKFTKLEKEAKRKANDAGLYRTELTGSEVAEEMEKERKIFQLQMCMYLIKVNEIKTKKGVDLLQYLVEYYKAVQMFFENGQREVSRFQTFIENLGHQLKEIKQSQNQEKQHLQELQTSLKNSMAGYKEPSSSGGAPTGYNLHQISGNKDHGSDKDGYLLKKSEGMIKKLWQKRKCRIKDGVMSINHADEAKDPVKLNLLTCQVKLVSDEPGKKCFDLVSSHGNRTYHFQAEDEKEMEQWISVLSNAKEEVLHKAFQESGSSPTMSENVRELTKSIIDRIQKQTGNNVCCDCGDADPKWLSTNLGVLICLECCGIHRNLGVHVSRTQSLEIDQLGTSQLLLARVIGNDSLNEILEARLTDTQKPKPGSKMDEKERFIKDKYIHHKFTYQTCNDISEQQQDLKQAIQQRDILSVMQVYAEGLDLMTVIPESPVEETALHLAIAEEDGSSLHIVDFIIQNSDLNSLGRQTRDGNSCLHLCAIMNKSECMKCLLRTKPDIAHLKNNAGQTALDIAKENNLLFCAELLEAAMAGKKDGFENINIEWDLMTDDGPEYSDDELEEKTQEKKSRPPSLDEGKLPRDESPRRQMDSEVTGRHAPGKPRKHHLTHPTRFRNSMRNIPGLGSYSQSLPNSTPLSSSHGSQAPGSPDNPPLIPPRIRPDAAPLPPVPPGGMRGSTHMRTVSDPETDISYVLKRNTMSEPAQHPMQMDNRMTVNFPMVNRNSHGLPDSDIKPNVPPRPRPPPGEPARLSRSFDAAGDAPPPIPAPRKVQKKPFRRCEALFDCDADNEDELSFREGEVIILVREEEEEWWEGEIENAPNRRGLFPISFVKPLPD